MKAVGVILLFVSLVTATAAFAQLAGKTGVNMGPRFDKWDQFGMGLGGPFSSSGGGGGCSNSLDFSQACNSQYVGIL